MKQYNDSYILLVFLEYPNENVQSILDMTTKAAAHADELMKIYNLFEAYTTYKRKYAQNFLFDPKLQNLSISAIIRRVCWLSYKWFRIHYMTSDGHIL